MLSIVFISMLTCSKTPTFDQKELIFGINSQFCRSECTKLYLYKNEAIYPQVQKYRFPADVLFSTIPLGKEKYESALKVLALMPKEIKNATENIGCPGCVDEPVIYLGFKDGNDRDRIILVDIKENDLPESLKTYVADFLKLMDLLDI